MSTDHVDHTGATEGPTWWYVESGAKIHARPNCPALANSVPLPATTFHEIPGNRGLCTLCARGGPHPYESVEKQVCAAVPLDCEHVSNQETHRYDARVTGDSGDRPLTIGAVAIEPGTEIEIKTCQRQIDDGGSNAGYRHGRWRFTPTQHDRVIDAGRVYLLGVLEDGSFVGAALVAPDELDALLTERWTASSRTNHHDREARLPWPELLDPSVLEGSA